MIDSDKNLEQVQSVFKRLQELPIEAPPYLETRVLARWKERQALKSRFNLRRWWAVGATAVGFAALALVLRIQMQGPIYEAFVSQPFVVRIDIPRQADHRIAKLRMELPEGVYFELGDVPGIRAQRSLTLRSKQEAWSVPFVLSADETGTKTIHVRFLDENDRVVGERDLKIRLKTGIKG